MRISNSHHNFSFPSDKTVLIVEDNLTQLEEISGLLESEFNTLAVADIGAALEIIKSRKVGLLIADLKINGSDGLEIIKKSKALNKSIKTILITGFSSEEVAIRALQIGVDYYFVKPFMLKDLLIKTKELFSTLDLKNSLITQLTKRELEIAELIAVNKKPYWISNNLKISLSTVRTHIRNIFKKLGSSSKDHFIENFKK